MYSQKNIGLNHKNCFLVWVLSLNNDVLLEKIVGKKKTKLVGQKRRTKIKLKDCQNLPFGIYTSTYEVVTGTRLALPQ